MRELPPPDPFPIDALGALTAAADAIHQRVQAPAATCGQSVLAAAALAVQGLVDVSLPSGQVRPVSNFFITVSDSGERKTSVDDEALRPIRQQERNMRAGYAELALDHANGLVAWERAREALIKKLGSDVAAIKAALNEIGQKPKQPWMAKIVTGEPTLEGLHKLFEKCRPSLGIFSSEAGEFIAGHGMADDARIRTAAGLSKFWGAETVDRVRADGASSLPDRRLSVHLMAQPEIAAVWLGDPMLNAQGMLARFLVSAPEGTAGYRFFREWSGNAAATAYETRLLDLISRPLDIDETTGGLVTRQVTMSPAARRAWIAFFDWTEERLRPEREYASIRGLASKLAEHAGRLAAVIAAVGNPDIGEIDAVAMDCGTALARHYAAEALRFCHGASPANPDLMLAQKALAWLSCRDRREFYMMEMYQFGPAAIREKATAMKIVRVLADHGYIERVKGPAEIDGKLRKEVWRLVSGD
jgi:hypothetical protein